MSVQGGGNSTGSGYSLRALDKDGNVDFFVRGDGNVGIGTTSPGVLLTVRGTTLGTNVNDQTSLAQIEGSRHKLLFKEERHGGATAGINWDGVTYKLQKKVDSTPMQSINFVHDTGAGAVDNHIDLYVGGHNVTSDPIFSTRFAGNGNVGIGTTNPGAKLDLQIDSGHPFYIRSGTGANDNLFLFENPSAGPQLRMYEKATSNVKVKISTHNDTYFNGGNVGIGTTNPDFKLTVDNGIGNEGLKVIAGNNGDSSESVFEAWNNKLNGSDPDLLFKVRGDGNVGIGTTSPAYKLDVRGAVHLGNLTSSVLKHIIRSGGGVRSNLENGLRLVPGSAQTTDQYISFHNGTSAQTHIASIGSIGDDFLIRTRENSSALFIEQSGNVGIGTTNPGEKLEVAGTIKFGDGHTIGNGGGDNLHITSSSGENIIYQASGGINAFWGETSERMRINSDGNVGIGTTSPSAKLTIEGTEVGTNLVANNYDASIKIRNTSDTDGNFASLDFYNSTNYMTARIGANFIDAGDRDTALYFATRKNGGSLAHQMVIDEDGNVGIGVPNPQVKLEVNGGVDNSVVFRGRCDSDPSHTGSGAGNNARFNLVAFSSDAGNDYGGGIKIQTRDGVNVFHDRMTIDAGGNVGIGTTNPDATLHVRAKDDSENALALWVVNKAHDNSIISAYENGDVRFGSFTYDDATGKVGIGTTSPNFKTSIMHGANGNDEIVLALTADDQSMHFGQEVALGFGQSDTVFTKISSYYESSNGFGLKFYTGSTTSTGIDRTKANPSLTIDSSGNVGIGTSSPSSKITGISTVDSTFGNVTPNASDCVITIANKPTTEAENNHASLQFNLNAGTLNHVASISLVSESATLRRGALAFCTDNGTSRPEAMRIDSSGNVGIGTTDPVGSLHIQDTSANQINLTRALDIRGSAGGASAEIHGGALVNITPTMGGAIGFTLKDSDGTGGNTDTEGALYFKVKNSGGSLTEKMRITSSGSVGIGTTSPLGKLSIQGAGATDYATHIVFNNTSGVKDYAIGAGIHGDTNSGFGILDRNTNNALLYINNGGNVGIGTSDAGSKLEVNGSFSATSKSFKIDHPLPEKSETHDLYHVSIEGPTADLIYRGVTKLENGVAEINIDSASRMTEGTFEALCTNVQCFTTNETSWDLTRGKVTGNILKIECQDPNCTDEISWMVIGERKDKSMLEHERTDDNGRLVPEWEKPKPEPEPEYEMVDSDEVVTEEPVAEEAPLEEQAPVEEPVSEETTEEVVEEPVAEEVSEESSEAVSLSASISSASLDEVSDLRAEETVSIGTNVSLGASISSTNLDEIKDLRAEESSEN